MNCIRRATRQLHRHAEWMAAEIPPLLISIGGVRRVRRMLTHTPPPPPSPPLPLPPLPSSPKCWFQDLMLKLVTPILRVVHDRPDIPRRRSQQPLRMVHDRASSRIMTQ